MGRKTRIEIAKEAGEQPAFVNRTALRSGKFKIIRDADGLLQIVGDKPPRAKDALIVSEKEALEMADIMKLLHAKSHYTDSRTVKNAESERNEMNVLEQINRLVKQAQVGTLAGLKLPSSAFQPGTTPPKSIFSLPLREFNKYWQQREQNSPLKKMKPIDYFSQYKGSAPSERPASPSAAQTARQTAKQTARQSTLNDLTASRQAVVMPKGTGIKGSGWTGREVVQGGSAPVSRVDPSAVKPFSAIHGMPANQIAGLKSMQIQNRLNAEGAAYDEILARLNRNGGDPQLNAQNARRLAPLVAKNYRRQADGSWKAISDKGKAQAVRFANRLTPSTPYRAIG